MARPRYEGDEIRPKRKKRKSTGRGGYRTSPVRYLILGGLVVALIVVSVLLYLKWEREKKEQASAVPPIARVG